MLSLSEDAAAPAPEAGTRNTLLEYFGCPDVLPPVHAHADLSAHEGFFTCGDDLVAYGRCSGAHPAPRMDGPLPDVLDGIDTDGRGVVLPFDLSAVVENLRYERYVSESLGPSAGVAVRALRACYYAVRPLLVLPIRKRLQRAGLSGWERIQFPRWPVDVTVDTQMQRVLAILLRTSGIERLPFIWFWPDGAQAGMMMTHDVETSAGLEFCSDLMDIDDAFDIKSSIEIVPEQRYHASARLLDTMRQRGFEVNVHDLNHDGRLFDSRLEFERRAREINRYVRQFECRGFRSGGMYRNQRWFGAFDFFYDMSVPNVAHLEPQRGGCCTVMPYFIGGILELPLTTIQDYSLFHILGDYSIDLWRLQIDLILEQHGLISLITHPDYLIERRARGVYEQLLAHLIRVAREANVWMTKPGDLERWWRSRSRMRLVDDGDSCHVEGRDADRARIAYASLDGDRLVYTLDARQGACR